MLQRLAQLGIALLNLFEQSHVLDGYHGLSSKGLEKRDLLFGEGPNFLSADLNRPDRNAFTNQRCNQSSPNSDGLTESPSLWKFGFGLLAG